MNISDSLTKITMPVNKKNPFVQEIFTNNSIGINRDDDSGKAYHSNGQGIR